MFSNDFLFIIIKFVTYIKQTYGQPKIYQNQFKLFHLSKTILQLI